MPATNTTPNLGLSQFLRDDRPSWIADYNGDMNRIDAGVQAASTGPTQSIEAHKVSPTAHEDLFNQKAGKPSAVVVVLAAGNWGGAVAPYEQTVAVPGITASNNAIFDVANIATAKQVSALAAAGVWAIGQSAGNITFAAAEERPEVDIPLSILILG